MRNYLSAGVALTLGLCCQPVFVADNGIYLGASVGESGVSIDDDIAGENFSFDASSTGYKAIAGWRFLNWLAVEGNYLDLGSGDDASLAKKSRRESTVFHSPPWDSCP
jgi:hypothetical protein